MELLEFIFPSHLYTVHLEIFMRILFSQIMLKDMFAMLKTRNWGMVYLNQ